MKTLLAVATLGLAVMAPNAKADLMFTLNLSDCCGSGPFGVVALHQVNATTVQVTETLDPGGVFAGTPPPAKSLAFNVSKSFSYVAGTLTNGFTVGNSNNAPPFGTFSSFVDCTDDTVCGNGTSPPQFLGPLTFQITNASGLLLTDFIANAGGYYFASDIGWPKSGGGFNTGSVATNQAGTVQGNVPEPASIALLGGVLVLAANKLRRKLAKNQSV